MAKCENYLLIWRNGTADCVTNGMAVTYRRKTPATNSVMSIPVELNAIAPIAQADSKRRNCSGMSWQFCLKRSGMVPLRQVTH